MTTGRAIAATNDGIRLRNHADASGASVKIITSATAMEPPTPHVDAYVCSTHWNVPPVPVQVLVEPSTSE